MDKRKKSKESWNEYMRNYNKGDHGNLYNRWRSLVTRCSDPNHKRYPDYGGRGITVCEEWKTFPNFKAWALENGFQIGLQVDRRDNEKGYNPENCRFVTCATNNRNRSNNKLTMKKANEIRRLRAEGVSGPKIAAQFGVDSALIYRIVKNKQWVESGP